MDVTDCDSRHYSWNVPWSGAFKERRVLDAFQILAGRLLSLQLAGSQADLQHFELRPAPLRAGNVFLEVLRLEQLRGHR